ncbi:hypothetical protein TNCV_821781 [Trichonephila clavipes]|nr:hypothetical protein TNCV_821781 [Trichonephila clavipes]
MDESEIIPINDYDSDLESETDSKISINDSGSIDSFSDDFDFDISDDENDDPLAKQETFMKSIVIILLPSSEICIH